MSDNFTSILDRNFIYVPSARTNIINTFKSAGWIPPRQKYNPDVAKLEQLVRDLAFTSKYVGNEVRLREAALNALEPTCALNEFSHDV